MILFHRDVDLLKMVLFRHHDFTVYIFKFYNAFIFLQGSDYLASEDDSAKVFLTYKNFQIGSQQTFN